ncbi:hypothetical protein MP638_002099 [Amoeboaphelidium occidentale]|nr:hypothetical protein MP638_002099 [Amoeboaphelidium occidentale]
MPKKVSKNYRNKTPAQINEIRRKNREITAYRRSIEGRVRKGLKQLEEDGTEYVVIPKILSTMADTSYRRWQEERNSVPLPEVCGYIQPKHGRRHLEDYFPDDPWHHVMKYLVSDPGTTAQVLHTDNPDPNRFVFFGGMEAKSVLAVFNKTSKKMKKVEYNRGDLVIIKSTTIHAGWFNDSDEPHYRAFFDIGKFLLPQAGYKQLTKYPVETLKETFGVSKTFAEGLGSSKLLDPMLK